MTPGIYPVSRRATGAWLATTNINPAFFASKIVYINLYPFSSFLTSFLLKDMVSAGSPACVLNTSAGRL